MKHLQKKISVLKHELLKREFIALQTENQHCISIFIFYFLFFRLKSVRLGQKVRTFSSLLKTFSGAAGSLSRASRSQQERKSYETARYRFGRAALAR